MDNLDTHTIGIILLVLASIIFIVVLYRKKQKENKEREQHLQRINELENLYKNTLKGSNRELAFKAGFLYWETLLCGHISEDVLKRIINQVNSMAKGSELSLGAVNEILRDVYGYGEEVEDDL